ncbi:MAG: formylglycine-generating enzyme family protein [Pikeienuella sp.]
MKTGLAHTLMTAALTLSIGAGVLGAPGASAQDMETFTNSLGQTFVQVPAGSFLMGSPDSDPEGRAMERPQHEVTISRPLWVAATEVTQGQWEALMGGNQDRRAGQVVAFPVQTGDPV